MKHKGDGSLRLFGYEIGDKNTLSLDEVVIQASPAMLRNMADFLLFCAQGIENGAGWSHEHFKDFLKDRSSETPEIIITTSSDE